MYAYSVDAADVHDAAALRAEAMDVSDRWVESGCDPEDPQLSHEPPCWCARMRGCSLPSIADPDAVVRA